MAENDGKLFKFTVAAEDAGTRLDVFLAAQPELEQSRAQVQKLIQDGEVLVNGTPASKAGQRLKEGDCLEVRLPPPVEYKVEAEAIPLSILYEDSDLLVIDKPPGMVVHPAPGHYSGTLVNALLHHCRGLSGIGGVLRPGIVHRLDKDTSGLLVVAKTQEAHQKLVQQLKSRQVNRTYLALVKGNVPVERGVVNAPIGRHPVERKKMAVVNGGKEAVTHFKVVEQFPGYTLLEVELETGRTHQIRVHMAYIGHPVVGDPVYGKGENNLGLKRQALHAARLKFVHPTTAEEMTFSSYLPHDMEAALNRLQAVKRQ